MDIILEYRSPTVLKMLPPPPFYTFHYDNVTECRAANYPPTTPTPSDVSV